MGFFIVPMQANPPSAQPDFPGQPILAEAAALEPVLQNAAPFLQRVLSDSGGNASSMRVAMLLAIAVVLAAWVTVSVKTGVLVPLPDSVVTLLAILTGGKLAQKFVEPNQPPALPLPSLQATQPGGSPAVPVITEQAPAQPLIPASAEAAAQP